jgi:hypothetical protein
MKNVLVSLMLLPVVVVAAETNELVLAPPYGELPPTFWEKNWLLVAIGAFVLVVLAVLAIWLVRRAKAGAKLSPEQIAREALNKLSGQPEDGKLLSEASQILRRYVGAKLDFHGGEMTTAEFITALTRTDKLDMQLGESVCSFLRECDVNKFSPKNEIVPLDAVNRALGFVTQVEQQTATPSQK